MWVFTQFSPIHIILGHRFRFALGDRIILMLFDMLQQFIPLVHSDHPGMSSNMDRYFSITSLVASSTIRMAN
jgi:hypothetical protein